MALSDRISVLSGWKINLDELMCFLTQSANCAKGFDDVQLIITPWSRRNWRRGWRNRVSRIRTRSIWKPPS